MLVNTLNLMGKKNGGQTVLVWFPAAERRRMERMKYCGWCGADGDLEQEPTSGYQKMESKQNIAQYRALSRGGPMVNGMEFLFSVFLFSFFSLVCKRLC